MTILGCKTLHNRRRTYLKITTFWAVTSFILVENTNISDQHLLSVFMKEAPLPANSTLHHKLPHKQEKNYLHSLYSDYLLYNPR
jgi:hypothetical protein